MKKACIMLILIMLILTLAGCEKIEIDNGTAVSGYSEQKQYSENSDGTWECDGVTYKYRLTITGRMNNAAHDSTFVYLSNIEEITFEQAFKAAGLSSNTDDYFDINDAILVECY